MCDTFTASFRAAELSHGRFVSRLCLRHMASRLEPSYTAYVKKASRPSAHNSRGLTTQPSHYCLSLAVSAVFD